MHLKTERLLLLFAIPLIVVGAPLAVLLRPADMAFVYRHLVFVLALFLSIPLTLLVTICLRWVGTGQLGRLLWIKQPSVSLRTEPAGSLAEIAVQVRQRLAAGGFARKEQASPVGDVLIDFTKQKAAKPQSFVDHAFRGTVSLSSTGPRPETAITVIFDGIILIETGEYSRLRALAGYLLGTEATLVVRQPPLTLLTGVTLAVANLVALILGLLDNPSWVRPTFSTSLAAAALCIWGLVIVLRDRRNLEGLGLGALGLAAAAVPFLMLV